MGNEVRLHQDGNTFYLLQNISGMSLYQKTKAIEKFIKHETKILESCLENELSNIFARNGINVYDKSESALKLAFDTLKGKGKEIVVTDIYKDRHLDGCNLIGCSPNKMTVWLEDDELLQCGVRVEEKEIL